MIQFSDFLDDLQRNTIWVMTTILHLTIDLFIAVFLLGIAL